MVLLGVLLGNIFGLTRAVLPVVGMLACEFTNDLTAVGFTGYGSNRFINIHINMQNCNLQAINSSNTFPSSLRRKLKKIRDQPNKNILIWIVQIGK